MPDRAQYGEQDEQGSRSDISPTQEWVFTTNPSNSRNHNRLGSLVRLDGEVCIQSVQIVGKNDNYALMPTVIE